MLGTIYTSLSGMQAYRTGLDVISNNVANMNTPGFKLSDPLFRDLVQQYGGALGNTTSNPARGAGVQVGDARIVYQQGDLRDTGNSLDAAIEGAGFFVLELDGRRIYARAGQFEFNEDGLLVDRETGARVLVSTDSAALGTFDLNTVRTFAPRATAEVTLSGTLARGGTTTTYSVPNVTLFDTSGAQVVVTARFVRDSADPLHWTLEVLDSNNAVIGTGDIRFNADGTPATGANSVTVNVTPTNSTPAFAVAFNLGTAGAHNGATSISGTTISQLQVLRQDGRALGTITRTEFTEEGQLKITYSNGEERLPARLLIARFDAQDQLAQLGGSRFALSGDREPVLGTALNAGMGRVLGGKIEMSNVDLTNQFTDLIIVQRGFQGSSQIASVANEMMQQLLAMGGGK